MGKHGFLEIWLERFIKIFEGKHSEWCGRVDVAKYQYKTVALCSLFSNYRPT